MSWIEAAPTALALLVLLYLPGWFGLRLLGVRGVLALAVAPAPLVLVLAGGAVALDVLGVRWGPGSVLALLVVVVGLCALAGRVLPRGTVAVPPLGRAALLGVVAALGFLVVLQGSAYLGGMERPDAVQQIFDPVFHLNAAETIVRTGNASSLGGLDPMYGSRTGVYYPAVWHSVVALVAPMSSVVVATNVLMLLTGLVVWPLGLVALGRAVAPQHPLVAVAAPVVAASFLAFPANLLVLQGMFTYCLALAMSPAAVALAVHLVQGPAGARGRAALATAAACGGVVAAHASGLGVLALFLLPLFGQEILQASARLRRAGRRRGALALAALVPVAAGSLVVAVLTVPQLRSMADFPVPDGSFWGALLRALTSATTVGWTSPWANAVVAALVLLGVAVCAFQAQTRWLAAVWVLVVGAYVVAAGPESPLRALTGFWYSSHDRTLAMLPTVWAVLGAIGAVALGTAVQRLVRSPGSTAAARARHGRAPGARRSDPVVAAVMVGVLAVAFVTSGAFRNDERERGWTAWAFQPAELIHPPYASADELEMIRSLETLLPEDAVVLGDPLNGAPFVQAVAGLVAYVPHVNPSSWDADQEFLMTRFRDLHADPAVCELVDEAGIDYYYADDSGPAAWREQAPGLYAVDVSRGFELVTSAGPAAVYRITACG